ncbi:DivIVA domain-containing protein [Streptomyces lavendulae]|uniref:DivIVA domain-containing protein n=2 Tax=Streptomyces lavendulae TaxID=1914 RepID=UPI00331897B8
MGGGSAERGWCGSPPASPPLRADPRQRLQHGVSSASKKGTAVTPPCFSKSPSTTPTGRWEPARTAVWKSTRRDASGTGCLGAGPHPAAGRRDARLAEPACAMSCLMTWRRNARESAPRAAVPGRCRRLQTRCPGRPHYLPQSAGPPNRSGRTACFRRARRGGVPGGRGTRACGRRPCLCTSRLPRSERPVPRGGHFLSLGCSFASTAHRHFPFSFSQIEARHSRAARGSGRLRCPGNTDEELDPLGADMARYSGDGETRRGLGAVGLFIGMMLLLGGGCAAMDAESPRCGGESMKPGDACVGTGGSGSYDGYEDKQEEAGQASFWLLRVGGALAGAGGLALAVGPVADAAWRIRSAARRRSRQQPSAASPPPVSRVTPPTSLGLTGLTQPAPRSAPRPAPRATARPAPRPASAAPPPTNTTPKRPPTLPEQLAQELDSVEFPQSRLQPGYDRHEVDAFLKRIRASLLGGGPAAVPAQIRAVAFSTAGHRQTGYDRQAVDTFLTALADSLRAG